MQKDNILLSGAQPSGDIHIGNYFGAIENWIKLQDSYKSLFGVMDLHAITSTYDPKLVRKNALNLVITYLACGIDPKKSTIFIQSEIKEHLELSWILSCNTPMGWLNRMTQFKDKSQGRQKENINHGLYSYPILMAADILLYGAGFVPVGNDQKQHLELTVEICQRFNNYYKTNFLKVPQYVYSQSTRIMSLVDGSNKMSKSDVSELSRINISDSKEDVVKKIKKCKTDSIAGISYDKNRLEVMNLLQIFSACIDKGAKDIADEYRDKNFSIFKSDLAEALIIKILPIQEKISDLRNDISYVDNIIKRGNESAREIANKNMKEIRRIVGF
jgi:tryptophanyl-tRNA synthetase